MTKLDLTYAERYWHQIKAEEVMTKTIEDADQQPQRFRDRAREIELEAAVRRFWSFARSAVPLDALTEDMQDECWALDALGKELLTKKAPR